MVKRWMTILFLLVFSALPIAAQVYQAADLICAGMAQAGDDEETMACCTIAGQCKMKEMMPEAAVEGCLTQCLCDTREPLLPVGLLSNTPPLPQADETIIPQPLLAKWAELTSTNSLLRFWPPPKTSLTNFRYTCLRI